MSRPHGQSEAKDDRFAERAVAGHPPGSDAGRGVPAHLSHRLRGGVGTAAVPGEATGLTGWPVIPSASPGNPEAASQRGLPPHQFTSARRLGEESDRPSPYSEGKRLGYGPLSSGWTLLLVIAGFSLLPHGSTAFSRLLAFALAIITGRYAYRIWTWQAKRLIFFIIW
jgi:hypothetical protein